MISESRAADYCDNYSKANSELIFYCNTLDGLQKERSKKEVLYRHTAIADAKLYLSIEHIVEHKPLVFFL